jgi:16S rRNA (guanine966-N2)-methyltransferase
VRVVAGEARGRRFQAPSGRTTRPTSDRVREAIFGVLGSLATDVGVSIDDAIVADLFAGSGAFGIEALSRGAARAFFIETDRNAVATIQQNLVDVGMADRRAVVVATDALRWLRTAGAVDLALCDPPYAFDRWAELVSLLAPIARLVVLETGAPLELGASWEVLKEKHYGGTVVMVARPARRPEPAAEPLCDRRGDT